MDLFSNLQLLHEAAISVLVTTTYGRWRTITMLSDKERSSQESFACYHTGTGSHGGRLVSRSKSKKSTVKR